MGELEDLSRGAAPQIGSALIKEIAALAQAARRRATSLRDRAHTPERALPQVGWITEALQELEVAHEELRVTEEALYAQADELVATRGVLGGERDHYRELFDGAPEPYVITDLHGVILEANRQACQLLEVDHAFIAGKPIAIFVLLEDRPFLRDMLEQPAAQALVSRFELRLMPRGAAASVPSEVSLCCSWLRTGKPSSMRFIFHLPAARLAQPSVPARADPSAPADPLVSLAPAPSADANGRRERQATLLTNINDELRGPLGVIKGWLQFLGDKSAALPLRERAQLAIARNVDALGCMLEQLIDNSRAAEELLTITRCETELGTLVRELVESSQPHADADQITLSVEIQPELPPVQIDPLRIRQAVFELLSNALRFTPRGGRVQVTVAERAGCFSITVQDSGRGIPDEQLAKIFEPFVRLSGAGRRAPGLGLGLSIARRLVALHGGTLTAASPGEGQGATFQLNLPSALADSAAAAE